MAAIRCTFDAKLPAIELSRSWEPKANRISYDGKDKSGKPVKYRQSRARARRCRRASPYCPTRRAIAAITATALALFHDLDASVMIPIWNLGTAAVMVGLAAVFGGRLFSWAAPR